MRYRIEIMFEGGAQVTIPFDNITKEQAEGQVEKIQQAMSDNSKVFKWNNRVVRVDKILSVHISFTTDEMEKRDIARRELKDRNLRARTQYYESLAAGESWKEPWE